MPLSPSQINVISVFVEGALYGIFFTFFIGVVYIQIITRRQATAATVARTRTAMFIVTVVMFIDANVHMFFVLIQTVDDGTVTPKIAFIIQLHIIMGDVILIWRVWMLWNCNRFRPYVVMIPVIILALNLAFGIQAVVQAVQQILNSTLIILTSALTIANTVLCTGLIIYQIKSNRNQNSVTSRVIYLLTETGAFCTAGHITALILSAVHSPALIIGLRILIPLTGIIQTWTMIYVYLHTRKGGDTYEQSSSLVFGHSGPCSFSTTTETSEHTSSRSCVSYSEEIKFDLTRASCSCDTMDTTEVNLKEDIETSIYTSNRSCVSYSEDIKVDLPHASCSSDTMDITEMNLKEDIV